MSGRISFIGAGPGAADLITMRGARRLAEADVVVWSASQVAPECVWEHARTDAEMVDSSRLRHEEAVELFRRAERDRLTVVRMHSGDPSLWGEVQDQHDACARMQLEVEVVPGVAAFSAAAASVGRELANPEVARSVVLARLDGGKAPMPDGAKVRELARHGTTMAVSLAAARVAQLVEELREGGYPEDTPVLVAYKVSLPDEQVLRTTLGELQATVKQHKLWRNALFLVGRSVAGASRGRYGSGGGRGFRRSEGAGRSSEPREQRRPSWAPSGGSGSAERVPQQRPGARAGASSESDVAWWAVREWQDSARGGTRVASRSAAARQVEQRHQSDLFAGDAGDDGADAGRMAEVVDLTARAAQSRVDGADGPAPSSEVSSSEVSSSADPGSAESPTASTASESEDVLSPAPAAEPSAEPGSAAGSEVVGETAPAEEPATISAAESPADSAAESPAVSAATSTGTSTGTSSGDSTGTRAPAAKSAKKARGQRAAADDGPAAADVPQQSTASTGGESPDPSAGPADEGGKAAKPRSAKAAAKATQRTSSASKSGKAASGRRKSASGKQNQRAGESSGQESGSEQP